MSRIPPGLLALSVLATVVVFMPSVVRAESSAPGPGLECSPGTDCTPPDSCILYMCTGNGSCVGVAAIPCNDGNPCTEDVCPNRQCAPRPFPDGTECRSINCHLPGICQAGTCQGETPVNCDDSNLCTTDACSPGSGQCVYTPVSCDDGNFCTADSCFPATGACTSVDIGAQLCNDGSACTNDYCDPVFFCHHTDACDDGNSCTLDRCATSGSACTHFGQPGALCDDGNECTLQDRCSGDAAGGFTCAGTGPACPDDGDPCTIETVDPESCLCGHVPRGCSEAGLLKFLDDKVLEWPMAADASVWNSYRGTIPPRHMGIRGTGLEFDHACFESGDAFGDGPDHSTEAGLPVLGEAFYYLVSAENDCAESDLGRGWSGVGGGPTPRPNALACPSPPP